MFKKLFAVLIGCLSVSAAYAAEVSVNVLVEMFESDSTTASKDMSCTITLDTDDTYYPDTLADIAVDECTGMSDLIQGAGRTAVLYRIDDEEGAIEDAWMLTESGGLLIFRYKFDCPKGFRENSAPSSMNECTGNFGGGYTYDEATKSVVPCPAGYYCPGGTFTYANRADIAKTCEQFGSTGGLRNYINSYMQEKEGITDEAGMGDDDFIHYIKEEHFKNVFLQSVTVGSQDKAAHIGQCYFKLPENKRITVTKEKTTLASSTYTHYFNLVDCDVGMVSAAGTKVTYENIAENWLANQDYQYASNCTWCATEEFYESASKKCVPCDIMNKLGLDESIEYEYTGNSTTMYLNEQCAYNFPEISFNNAVIKNMRCHMACELNESNTCVADSYYYQCFVDPAGTSETLKGYVGCAQGHVASAVDKSGAVTSCSLVESVEDVSIGALTTGTGDYDPTYVQVLTPSETPCGEVKDGCYQSLDVDGFADLSDTVSLFNALLGTPCTAGTIPDGDYCTAYGPAYCPAGYYCKGGIKNSCPAGTTSAAGSSAITACYLGGDSEICDENLKCFTGFPTDDGKQLHVIDYSAN